MRGRPRGATARCGFRCGHPRTGENVRRRTLRGQQYDQCVTCYRAALVLRKTGQRIYPSSPWWPGTQSHSAA